MMPPNRPIRKPDKSERNEGQTASPRPCLQPYIAFACFVGFLDQLPNPGPGHTIQHIEIIHKSISSGPTFNKFGSFVAEYVCYANYL